MFTARLLTHLDFPHPLLEITQIQHIEQETEKAMASHSSTLAWKIPWTEEPGGLPSMGSHRVRHDRSDLAAAAAAAELERTILVV